MSSASLLGPIKLSIICNENLCNVFNNIIQGNVIHQTRPTSSTALLSRSGCSWNTSHLTSSEPNVMPSQFGPHQTHLNSTYPFFLLLIKKLWGQNAHFCANISSQWRIIVIHLTCQGSYSYVWLVYCCRWLTALYCKSPSFKKMKQTNKQEKNKIRCQHCSGTWQDLDVQSLHVTLRFTVGHSPSTLTYI